MRLIKENLANKFLKKPELANSVKEYIFNNAIRNNPQSVLDVMDQYAKKERFLMNVGDVKGKILIKEIKKLRENPIILELGCFCCYSAILMVWLALRVWCRDTPGTRSKKSAMVWQSLRALAGD